MSEKRIIHAYLDLAIEGDWLTGADVLSDSAPMDGDVIRRGGQLYRCGEPVDGGIPLRVCTDREIPAGGIWWDADDPSYVEAE